MAGPDISESALRGVRLARLLLAVYALLVVYVSLYPFSGWRSSGGAPWDFLALHWPRYATAFDAVANILGYVPLGLLGAISLYPVLRNRTAAWLATAAALILSFAVECAQGFLPSRVASTLDLLCNFAGALLGTVLALRWGPHLLAGGAPLRWRAEYLERGAEADLGLVLTGLWLVTQLNPATLLFGTGDLRDLLAPTLGAPVEPQLFVVVEAITAGANLAAMLLLLSVLVPRGRSALPLLTATLAIALVVKTAAFAIILHADRVLAWFTPGAELGLLGGLVIVAFTLRLPRNARIVIAALLLMTGTAVVNLAPPNPYLGAILKVWQQGHFLNFNGFTRTVSVVWPFAALGFVVWLALRRGADAPAQR